MMNFTPDLRKCEICPRMCGVDRVSGKTGFCGQTSRISAARAALHFWEEPCISGSRGSGTVFFSGCTLKCSFCQNRQISTGGFGAEITTDRLAGIFLKLQEQGAHNINLVSPTQYAPQIIDAVASSKNSGLAIPVVWNTGGYERPETIAILKDTVDIFLTDLKYMDPALSKKFSHAEDYPDYATAALEEMVKAAGAPVFDETGIMTKGVIVRHLALPGCIKDTKNVLKWLHDSFGNKVFISIMSQYTPPALSDGVSPERPLRRAEYSRIIDWAVELGIEQAFVQELDSVGKEFTPTFDLTGIK